METASQRQAADEKSRSDRLLELGSALLLALATVATAWCVYESERWGGVQVFRLNDSDNAGRDASELAIKANHDRLLDTVVFMRFMTALEQNNKTLQQFYMERFRPEMRTAVEAWLATQPMTNPGAPLSPFVMSEYHVPLADQAQSIREKAAHRHDAAVEAKQNSERYTMLTVLLASVFFFGGIATHFQWPPAKIIVFLLGILVFLATVFQIATCPLAP
ncbi:MAG: hypothetical protein ACM359_02530 [Bacillota bacterium]